MPNRLINGVRLYVEEHGEGRSAIVFSHGLLWSTRLFAPQLELLGKRHRCIAYDHRGQGRSEVPVGDEVSIETCYRDAIALIERLELAPCHFVGLSMGGFVGMRIAARRPDMLRSLSLLETAADPEPRANLPKYQAMNAVARLAGVKHVMAGVLPIMFSRSFLSDPQNRSFAKSEMLRNQREIYKSVNGVVRRDSVEDEVQRIRTPTLIVHGDEDKAIVRSRANDLHRRIEHSQFVTIPRAGHSSTVENPAAVNRALQEFINSVS